MRTGRMHDRVHGAVAGDEVVGEGGGTRVVADVEPMRLTLLAECGEQFGRGVGAVRDRDPDPLRREGPGDRGADPAGPSGHHGDAGQVAEAAVLGSLCTVHEPESNRCPDRNQAIDRLGVAGGPGL
ncbi:hypothetical protein [Microbacterium sp. Se63.02b]|uniref:hypothetical protein n=1 Tax=Microbacterium sp. Se63.02b TaxID=2709304 RepID=UPI001FCE6CD3|nr:hypothetical protein [Microbacterium sp. Se63.02b]